MMLADVGNTGALGGDRSVLAGVSDGDIIVALMFAERQPASSAALLALPRVCPTKFGITNAGGAAACVTSKPMLGEETSLAAGTGFWETTSSGVVPGVGRRALTSDTRTAASTEIPFATRGPWKDRTSERTRFGLTGNRETTLQSTRSTLFTLEMYDAKSRTAVLSASRFSWGRNPSLHPKAR